MDFILGILELAVEDPAVEEDPGVEDPAVEEPGVEVPEVDTGACIIAGICLCYWISTIITVGFTCLTLWLSFRKMRPSRPHCSIEYFYVPSLNKVLHSHSNNTINFMVRLDNPNKDKGIYYDDVYLTLSSFNTKTNASGQVANYTVPKFYQGHKKRAKKWGQVLPMNNQTVLHSVLPNGSAVFRLDLKTKVRFKIVFFKTPRFKVKVGADVEVNGDGVKASEEGIKMKKSDSSSSLRSYFPVCVLMNLVVCFAIS